MKFKGFTKKQLMDVYEKMALSRYLDDKQLILLKQGKDSFILGGQGMKLLGWLLHWHLSRGSILPIPIIEIRPFVWAGE